jgi:Eco57I restriction-modification methylase/TaqI-like C-terminal specificity domain
MAPDASSRESARATIAALVEHYARSRDRYRSSTYNEETCRAEFITPLFGALGWDVTNKAGYAEQYKDVIHEEGIKVGDFTKAPDYTFRVAGVRKFFVEAKKPFVDLKSDPAPAYQLRRYAWSAKLPLSVLTDFEEIAVYDTRIRPNEGDKPSVARILYLTYDELLSRLDELWGVFSKDAVLKGSFDRYAEETRGKRGTSEVDAEFLREIEAWRDELARNIAIRNENLSVDDLNFAVQTTIDRIIFLRIAEGRGAEPYGSLLGLVNGADIYQRLVADYRKADARYNSGLFDFKTDRLTTGLTVDDKVLKPILFNLYYPQSPYEFSVLPVEILGNVYEQFLGKVIRLTKGHRAVVEEKPEVKKAGGVYYTPAYIVDYIVTQTVSRLCEGKSPKQMEKLRILDPACGSGSFLLRAYQELLDRHLAWYRGHQPEKHRKEVFPGPGGDWRLTTAEKRRIVLNNIYGVDIDRQAVEVTKLSLLLKVLEGENDETLRQHSLFGERALPSLEGNIKWGNSLIAPQDLGELAPDADELRRINPFSWKSEFPAIFRAGGFDVVVGNPPYIRIQTMQEWAPLEVELYKTLYRSATSGNYDIYVVFVEKGLSLLNDSGRLGFILPHKFFNAQYGQGLRGLISQGKHLSGVVHFGDQQVFSGTTTYTCLLFLEKGGSENINVSKVSDLDGWRKGEASSNGVLSSSSISGDEWHLGLGASGRLVEKLSAMKPRLADVAHLFVGIQTDADDVFILEKVRKQGSRVLCRSKATGKEHWFEEAHTRAFLKGSLNIGRYCFRNVSKLLIFPYTNDNGESTLIPPAAYAREFPLTWSYLRENKERLEARNKGRMGDAWHGYVYKKNHLRMTKRKLLVPSLAKGSCFTSDLEGKFFFAGSGGGGGGGYGIILSDEGQEPFFYLLGVLNSRLLSYFLQQTSTPFRGGYYALNRQYIERLPIAGLTDPKIRKDVSGLANRAVTLRQTLESARSPQDQTALKRQIAATDESIDRIVYGLYGLSPEEIKTVEVSTRT